jgi:hypothetical protein
LLPPVLEQVLVVVDLVSEIGDEDKVGLESGLVVIVQSAFLLALTVEVSLQREKLVLQ